LAQQRTLEAGAAALHRQVASQTLQGGAAAIRGGGDCGGQFQRDAFGSSCLRKTAFPFSFTEETAFPFNFTEERACPFSFTEDASGFLSSAPKGGGPCTVPE
jgi:hypothetical protein